MAEFTGFLSETVKARIAKERETQVRMSIHKALKDEKKRPASHFIPPDALATFQEYYGLHYAADLQAHRIEFEQVNSKDPRADWVIDKEARGKTLYALRKECKAVLKGILSRPKNTPEFIVARDMYNALQLEMELIKAGRLPTTGEIDELQRCKKAYAAFESERLGQDEIAP